ncbi:MAG: 6-hydroxymethylpterin diphosphokinase MptE-like protein [Chlamydiia bacterium]
MSTIRDVSEKNRFLALFLQLNTECIPLIFHPPVVSEKELIVFDGIEWLESLPFALDKSVIFVESCFGKIRTAMEHPLFDLLLKNPNAYICYQKTLPCFTGGKILDVFSLDPTPLFMGIVEDIICFEPLYLEGQDFAMAHFKNVFDSLLTFSECIPLTTLKGDFHHPWLIVGAAPLSEQEVSQLRVATSTHYICAAGSATKKLLEMGIRPDFAAIVDPNPDEEAYIAHDIPVLFQFRTNTAILQKGAGPLIWAGYNNLYPFEGDLLTVAGFPHFILDGGYDSVNFSAAVAEFLGAVSIEYLGVSEGRDTFNDLVSRMQLKKDCEKKLNQAPSFLPLIKHWSGEKVVLESDALYRFYQKIIEAEDDIDLDRLGIVDGYKRPLKIFRGEETVSAALLQDLVEQVLKKKSRVID